MVYYACPYGNRKPQEILNMFASYQISIDAVIMDLSPSPKQKDGILSSLKKRLVNEHDGLTVDSLRSLGKTNREIAKELQWIYHQLLMIRQNQSKFFLRLILS